MNGKAGVFRTADDIDLSIRSLAPENGLQLKEAVDVFKRAIKGANPKAIPFFKSDSPPGQYALFFGAGPGKLTHVIHGQKFKDGTIKMFDPQNGQVVTFSDILSLNVKCGKLRTTLHIVD